MFAPQRAQVVSLFVSLYVCLQISVLLSISSDSIIFLASKGLSLQVVLSLCSSVTVTQLLLTRAMAKPTTQVSLILLCRTSSCSY